MTSRQLQLFLTIADQGSFSKAEKTEFISKQALLRQVNQLEDEVGEKLFLRTPYGISLTEAGRLFYDGAREILDLEDDVLTRCRKNASSREELRVSYIEHQALLNNVTEAFIQKYPDIRIHRVVHPNHSGEYRVEQGIADVGETFYTKYTASSPNAYTRLADMPYLAAMSRSHPLAEKTQVTLEALTEYPVIIYGPMVDAGYQQELRRAFIAKGRTVRDEAGKGRTVWDEAGKGRTVRDEAGKGRTVRDEAGKGRTVRDEAGKGGTVRDEAGKGRTVWDDAGKGGTVQGDAGKGRTVRDDAGKGRTVRDEAEKTEAGVGAPYVSGTPCLDIRRDVDAQVQAAFFCAETDAILLTANCFVRTIPELQTVPLAEDWHQEYGIIYQANPSRTVRKYIDLAVAQYAAGRR